MVEKERVGGTRRTHGSPTTGATAPQWQLFAEQVRAGDTGPVLSSEELLNILSHVLDLWRATGVIRVSDTVRVMGLAASVSPDVRRKNLTTLSSKLPTSQQLQELVVVTKMHNSFFKNLTRKTH